MLRTSLRRLVGCQQFTSAEILPMLSNKVPSRIFQVSRCNVPSAFASAIHTSSTAHASNRINMPKQDEVTDFMKENDKKYPPQKAGEAPRPAFVCNEMRNIKYTPKNMWYVASLIRGMTIEDAINQLKFCHKKGAVAVLDTILEAQRMAVEEHNVEFSSNLWVSESFCYPDSIVRTVRRHARMRMGVIKHRYVAYCCTLEEGAPPEHYYYFQRKLTPQEHIQDWLKENRDREIIHGL